ncbi:MAG TPA: hypothetical protein PLR27_08365 [Methanoregulaceae archaeon]|nr:hypothetical protein [Methanoregulaceae archaeon]HRU31635.1 hypothetical protein [Methanoregulaceae archaeon]
MVTTGAMTPVAGSSPGDDWPGPGHDPGCRLIPWRWLAGPGP